MNQSKEMAEAFNRLSAIATEESTGEDIPASFISKIDSQSPSKSSKLHSTYFRSENFTKDRSIKIENQKRLKFIEEVSELREKPQINSSFSFKVTLKQQNLPIHLRAEEIIRQRNLSINSKKIENSRKALLDDPQVSNKFGSISAKCNNLDFLENVRLWQMKKEKNIKQQVEMKAEKEIKGLSFTPTLNQRSMNIMKKLTEIQSLSISNTERKRSDKGNLSGCSFKPRITEKAKKMTINRTGSVFERLYSIKVVKKEKAKNKGKQKRKQIKAEDSSIERNYSINSGRGTISNRSFVEEVRFDKSMSFILENLM